MDEVDVDEEGIAEMLLDENTVANITRPGTSLKQPGTGQGVPSQGVRLVLNIYYHIGKRINIYSGFCSMFYYEIKCMHFIVLKDQCLNQEDH